MKTKHFCSLALLAISIMFMVACDKENPDTPDTPTVKAPVAALFNYSFTVTDSMRLVADFAISYFDENGQLQNEQLAANSWEKKVTAKLPAKLGVRVVASLKEGVDFSAIEKLRVIKKYSELYYCVDEDGNKVGKTYTYSDNHSQAIKGEQIPQYFNKDHFLQSLYTFDAAGEGTYHNDWK